MAVELLTPFTMVDRRSLPKGPGVLLTGRWVVQDAAGQAVLPGAANVSGLYLLLEGSHKHLGSNQDFGAGPAFASTNTVELPAVQASDALALAYGVFRYRVNAEGFDPAQAYVVGQMVTVDAVGRLTNQGVTTNVARVEAVATDVNGATELVLRTFGV